MQNAAWRSMGFAAGLLIVLTVLAFGASALLQGSGFLSPIPPGGAEPDVAEGETYRLYAAAFTAWVALILFIPALITFCREGSSRTWRIYWTVSYAAFVIHMAWAILVFFEGDMARVMSSTRVSAPVPGLVLLIWWGIDVMFSWIASGERLITAQRIALHIGATILFVGGSAATGETLPIKAIGVICFIAAIVALIIRWRGRSPAA